MGEAQLDSLTTRVSQAFRRASVLQQQIMVQKLSLLDSHPEEALCLRLLVFEDGISQARLAGLMHRSRQRISKLVGQLESRGAVTRRVHDHDQRAGRVYLTPVGRAREAELTVVLDTLGGIKTTPRLEVVDTDGTPIPGLYAARVLVDGVQPGTCCGELPGSAFGFAVDSGHVAGESAARFQWQGRIAE